MSRKRDRQSLSSEEMSFQDLVCDITTGQKQKDVTLPFYFICLLHLANEKVNPVLSCPLLHILNFLRFLTGYQIIELLYD